MAMTAKEEAFWARVDAIFARLHGLGEEYNNQFFLKGLAEDVETDRKLVLQISETPDIQVRRGSVLRSEMSWE